MNIYKLVYTDKETAIADLIAKGVIDEQGYTNATQAVVDIGKIVQTDATYDEQGNEITPAIYADGYHYDVMSSELYDFGANLVEPKNPKHAFAGHATTEEFPYEPQFLGDEA